MNYEVIDVVNNHYTQENDNNREFHTTPLKINNFSRMKTLFIIITV
jgi:hypothetical protein